MTCQNFLCYKVILLPWVRFRDATVSPEVSTSLSLFLVSKKCAERTKKNRPGHRHRPTVDKANNLLLRFDQLSVEVKASTYLLNYQNLTACHGKHGIQESIH